MTSGLRSLRYAGYALAALLWLIIMLAPCLAIALVAGGELNWQREDFTGDRIWFIQEPDQRGLGYAATRLEPDAGADGAVCLRTVVTFFLWEGSAQDENAAYCECVFADKTESIPCP